MNTNNNVVRARGREGQGLGGEEQKGEQQRGNICNNAKNKKLQLCAVKDVN